MKKKSKGFTLIELLIVISIIVILTIIIYASFGQAQVQSRDKKRVADISSIQLSLETYFNHYGQYPTSTAAIGPIPTPPSGGPSGLAYQYNYLPLTQETGSNASICTTYQLWTTLESSNQYLSSKKGFDSTNLSSTPFTICTGGSPLEEVNASPANSLVYDAMP